MKLTDNVRVLPIPRDAEDAAARLNPTLILDEANGPTLVDTGYPGQGREIGEHLLAEGVRTEDLARIILTHQDLDHTGSAAELVRTSGARVLAHPEDAPYIDGTLRPLKPTPQVMEQRPHMREMFERREPVRVDEPVEDGTRLDIAGGLRVIFTPGHTPGHVSLYLEREGILIAGDAVVSRDGVLDGPLPSVTLDMQTATRSLEKLADLEVRAVVCYHGGPVTEDAGGQLRKVARGLS